MNKSDMALYRRLLRQMRPYRAHMTVMLGVNLLATPLALLTPLPLKIVFDSVLGSRPVPRALDAVLPWSAGGSRTAILIVAGALVVVAALLTELQWLGADLLGTYVGERLRLSLRSELSRHVQRLSLAYHDRIGTADSTYRIESDASSIKLLATYGLTPLVTAAFTVAGMITVTALLDWQLAIAALATTPLLLFAIHHANRRLRTQWRDAKQLESSALSVVQEVLTGLRVVKAFGAEDREHERFLHRSSQGMRARLQVALAQGRFSLAVGLILAAGTSTVLVIGTRHVQGGIITAGDLLLVMGYLAQLYSPLRSASKSLMNLQDALAGAERAFSLLDEAPEVPERSNARSLRRTSGAITFDHVSFAYDGRNPVLKGISFEMVSGTRLGVAGMTGAGKTTLVSLLTRFYDPTSGQILLDGRDLRDYKLRDLRNQFGIVLQEPVLFSTSIAENIAYARPGASDRQIIDAARAANAHDFITTLPDGYDTLVGERGMRMSGGERQRISLARAFLKQAPILVLDEPTSSIDVGTEAIILEAMERLMQGRTAFVISHRQTLLKGCDAVLKIEAGHVARLAKPSPSHASSRAKNAHVARRRKNAAV